MTADHHTAPDAPPADRVYVRNNPLARYDIRAPTSPYGLTPYIDNANLVVPVRARPPPFDPATVTLEGNYLGSRAMRASKDPVNVYVLEMLDNDAVELGYKVWHRELEWMHRGIIWMGPRGEYHIFPIVINKVIASMYTDDQRTSAR